MKKQSIRINRGITAQSLLVIDEKGNSHGICSLEEALRMANERGLDLVEVATQSSPVVCKILDYGKYKYDLDKKLRQQHKKKQIQKEIRMQPKISEHDLATKVRRIEEFLSEGSKVKVAIRFRGRELAYTQQGFAILKTICDMLQIPHTLDKEASMEGNFMTMLVSPSSKSKQSKPPKAMNNEKSPADAGIEKTTIEEAISNTETEE